MEGGLGWASTPQRKHSNGPPEAPGQSRHRLIMRKILCGVVSSPSLEASKQQHQVLEKELELCTGIDLRL